MIKWVKFYQTGSPYVITFFTQTNFVQNDGQTHEFADAKDMLSKSTTEVFAFWDNEPMGVGQVSA